MERVEVIGRRSWGIFVVLSEFVNEFVFRKEIRKELFRFLF